MICLVIAYRSQKAFLRSRARSFQRETMGGAGQHAFVRSRSSADPGAIDASLQKKLSTDSSHWPASGERQQGSLVYRRRLQIPVVAV